MEDHDSPWKGALEEFFDPFLQLLFPEIHQSVDWTRPVRFLDKELQKLRPDSRMGRREVDKLAEVTFHGGTSQTLLIHVEVQGHPDRHFAKRMYLYHTRLRDHFDKPIIDLAVLADTNPKFRPTQFEERIKGKGLRLDFHSVKLLDYEARWEELLQSANPFALIVAAQLTAKREGRQSKHRVDNLLRFYRCAWRMGLSEEQHGRLLVFLDWLVALPPELEDYYNAAMVHFKEGSAMPFVSHLERFGEKQGLEKGRQEGRQEGRANVLLRQLQLKFGELPVPLSRRVMQADDAQLDAWVERVLFATRLEDVFASQRQRTDSAAT